jgi:uncharacterized protein YyaL (SSP411 family)
MRARSLLGAGLGVGLALLSSAAQPPAGRTPGAGPPSEPPPAAQPPAGQPRGAQPAAAAGKANRLIHESSPYLLLHAHNPVDWYPWGEEAFARARREDKPIFLSVGYSTCYWCHVMEREVFSQPAIAELMNRWFVSIKVDREERPDLDEIYITATELLNQSAGWPSSLFLTPGLAPFYAGTYFPPEDRGGLPGFPKVLAAIHEAWTERRPEVTAHAAQVAAGVREAIAEARGGGAAAGGAGVPPPEAAARAVRWLEARFDPAHGGFGGPPQFPSPANLFLLWQAGERGDNEARRMVLATLHRMGEGAIYDQLGGGFHRYTRDSAWRIPHFEKMLYDNAHLGELLAVTAKATGDPELERLARGTFDFVLRQMTLPGGGFKSAIDAETDGVEGAYYLWTRDELRAALDAEGFALLAPVFGFDGAASFEGGRYALYLTRPLAEHAARLGISPQALLTRLQPHLDRLLRVRARRKVPLVDDKALTDWNGMMIAALARGGALLGEPRYLRAAEKAAGFVLAELRARRDGTLLHAWRGGEAKIAAFLDDYAFLLRGLLALDQATGAAGATEAAGAAGSPRWLREAERLAGELERRLRDPRGGYFTAAADPGLLFQAKSAADGAIPSGNGIAALALLRLAERTGKPVYRRRAAACLESFARELDSDPQALPTMAQAVYRYHGSAVVAGSEAASAAPSAGAAGGGASRSPTEVANGVVHAALRPAPAPPGGGWRPFVLDLEIRDGWHVNANPASLDYLVPTRLEAGAAGGLRKLSYPAGKPLRFPFAGEALSVYTGAATIRGEAAPGLRALLLTYQACNDQLCLPPVHRSLPLPGAAAPP